MQGPILQFANPNTTVWDMAYSQTDIRANKCLPEPMLRKVPCCTCGDLPPPVPTIAAADFILCRPVEGEDGIAATDCTTGPQVTARPEQRDVLPRQCRTAAVQP